MNNTQPKHPLVVIPTFNNQGTLKDVVRGVQKITPHILVINDGSTDQTSEILNEISVPYLTHELNLGKGEAIRTALRYAKEQGYNTIITFDADGQHLPEDLETMMAELQNSPDSLVIGSRRMGEEAGAVPFSSKFGRQFSNFWIWAETGQWLEDTQSGFRSYPVNSIPFEGIKASRYDFEIEIIVRAIWHHIPVKSLSIGVYYPTPEERISHFHPWVDNARLSKIHSILVTKNILSLVSFGLLFPKQIRPKRRKEKSGAGILDFMLRLFGKRTCYALALFPIIFYYLFDSSTRKVFREFNGQTGSTPSRLDRWFPGLINYIYFSLGLIDKLYLAHNPLHKPKITREGPTYNITPGSILLGSHMGDWMYCGDGLSKNYPIDSVAVLMDVKHNPNFVKRLGSLKDSKIKIIDSAQDPINLVLAIREVLDENGVLCLMADRTIPGGVSKSLPFLGKAAQFPMGPYQLAKVLKKPVYAFVCTKDGMTPSSPYLVEYEKLWDGEETLASHELASRYVQFLEHQVKKKSAHWFNFYPFWHSEEENVL